MKRTRRDYDADLERRMTRAAFGRCEEVARQMPYAEPASRRGYQIRLGHARLEREMTLQALCSDPVPTAPSLAGTQGG